MTPLSEKLEEIRKGLADPHNSAVVQPDDALRMLDLIDELTRERDELRDAVLSLIFLPAVRAVIEDLPEDDILQPYRKHLEAQASELSALRADRERLREALRGDHEVKPMSEERLERILDFEEHFKAVAIPEMTATLDWSDQRALIDEAVLAYRARAALTEGERSR